MIAHPDQSNGGRFDAAVFLQSLADHGDAMTHTEAGEAFAQTVCDKMGAIARGVDAGNDDPACDDAKRFYAFLVRIGEALHQLSEMEREQRDAFSFDGGELRRLIERAHSATGKALRTPDNHSLLVDTVTALADDLQALRSLIGADEEPGSINRKAGRQVAQVISIALAEAARKKGVGDGG